LREVSDGKRFVPKMTYYASGRKTIDYSARNDSHSGARGGPVTWVS